MDKCSIGHRKQLTGRAVAAANEELWIGRTSTAVKGELYWWRLLLFMLFGCRLFMFMVTLNFVQRSGIHICSNSNSGSGKSRRAQAEVFRHSGPDKRRN